MATTTIPTVTLADGHTFELKYHDLVPALSDEVFFELLESIKARGMIVPVLINREGAVIDGQHRLKCAKQLDKRSTDIPIETWIGDPEDELALAIDLNLKRRHLGPEDRRRLVGKLRAGGLSNRAIAAQIGVDESTVRRDIERSGAADAAPEQPESEDAKTRLVGADGRSYPAEVLPADALARRRSRAKALAEAGKSVREIALELGFSVGTIAADLQAPAEQLAERAMDRAFGSESTPAPKLKAVTTKREEPSLPQVAQGDPYFEKMLEGAKSLHASMAEAVDEEEEENDEDEVDEQANAEALARQKRDQEYAERSARWQAERDAEEARKKAERDKFKMLKLDPDRWSVVLASDESQLVGLITRGSAPGQGYPSGYTGHVLLKHKGDLVEVPLRGATWGTHDTLKAALEDIAEARKSPQKFLKRFEESKTIQGSCGPRRQTAERPEKPKVTKPKGPHAIHDLDMGAWKDLDIHTSSFWPIGARARGDGHSASYHGNFVPQIPEQQLRRLTKTGDVVLDLFLGGATSMIEALKLGRRFIGVDIQPSVVAAAMEKAPLPTADAVNHDCFLFTGNSSGPLVAHTVREHLAELERDAVDHIFLHPPYWQAIRFTQDAKAPNPHDLSEEETLDGFLRMFARVVWFAAPLLRPGKFLTLVIGDVVLGSEWIPLSSRCMDVVLANGGLELVSIQVKDIQGNEKGAGKNSNLWRWRALNTGTLQFGHESIYTFRKTASGRKEEGCSQPDDSSLSQ